ncbi:MAG: glycoside hydrolase family 2 TIM barrel-domain containing protein [Prevotella sp.]|jgi:beta-galactosidase
MKSIFILLCCIWSLQTPTAARADNGNSTEIQAGNVSRVTIPLNSGWHFIRRSASIDESPSSWQTVTLPHCWNIVDGQLSGKNRLDENGTGQLKDNAQKVKVGYTMEQGYYRGPAWYAQNLFIPKNWKGKRVFVRFGAAGQVARVYVNGKMLGEHRGAFTAFCYELTPWLRYGKGNDLRVEVDNTYRTDLPPLSGDFNINGGLYRTAHLIITNSTCISPLDFASSGVYIDSKIEENDMAEIAVRTILDNGKHAPMSNEPVLKNKPVRLKVSVTDSLGRVVAMNENDVVIPPGTTQTFMQRLRVAHPIKWQGRQRPYLYGVSVALMQGDSVIDEVKQHMGIREVRIDNHKGFLLNGIPYRIYGVGRHQDLKDKAWALTQDDDKRDMDIISEMGATAIRFAHYPQNDNIHNIADEMGLLVWDEIPLVNEFHLDIESKHNIRMMMEEMIHQLYNHPSIAWWGLFNEIENNYMRPADDFLTELRDSIRSFDKSSRIIVAASDHGLRSYNKIPEAIGFNNYPGWYHGNYPKEEGYEGEFAQLPKWIEDRAAEVGKRIAISEYGAGGDVSQHTEGEPRKPRPAHGGPFQPEEWQTYVHEQDWRMMKNNQYLWGTFLWSMFDFASCMRNEGSVPSVNTKGIVSQDRKTKKDAYYFYKANWNEEPMVYITSRRSKVRKQQLTDIKVYSNCRKVTLFLNDKKIMEGRPDDTCICIFKNVLLKRGTNHIIVVGNSSRGRTIADQCEWFLE